MLEKSLLVPICSTSELIDSNWSFLIHCRLQLGKKRRHFEEAFEERTAELRALAECRWHKYKNILLLIIIRLDLVSPVGIFRADQNGNITFANSAW